MLRAGQRYHGEAMRKWRQVLFQLMRRTAGRDEVHLIEIESAVGCARHRQMPGMNGVKRATKESDAANLLFGCCAMRLRRRQS